ncbi:MAG: hypothetical protein ACYCX3_15305 [Thermoleophilia bacterium]
MSFPADTTPAPTRFDDLGRDLKLAAPHVTDVGAWEAILPRARRIRRRRLAFRGGVSLLLAAMLVGAAVYIAQLRPSGPGISESTLVQPTPGGAVLPPAPDSPTASVLLQDAPDPRAVAVRAWIQALHAGDLEAAWQLLDTRAQDEYGTQEAFAAAAPAFTFRWGAWGGADSLGDLQLIDLGMVDGERLAVVTVFGRWSSGPTASPDAHTAPRADSILVVSRPAEGVGDEAASSRIDPLRLLVADDPSESALVDEGKVPVFKSPGATGVTLTVGQKIEFKLPVDDDPGRYPTPLRGTPLLALNGTVVDAADQMVADDLGRTRAYFVPELPTGSHVVTLVFIAEDGGHMSAAAAFFTVGEPWGDPDEPPPTVPATDAPPLSEAASRAALESLDTLLRAVRLDDRESFVNLYHPSDRAAAEEIFGDERSRLQRLGSDAYYLAYGNSVRVNWIVGVDWGLTWMPMSPSPELGAWVTADPQTRALASITTMDNVTRFLPLDVDGDTVFIHVPGGDPATGALGAFDLLGRTPSDVAAAYFAALQKGEYEAAWELLSDARPPLDRFKEESAATATSDRREAGRYTILDNGDAWVDVTVVRAQPDVPPEYSIPYPVPTQERWLCVRQGGEWRLDQPRSI